MQKIKYKSTTVIKPLKLTQKEIGIKHSSFQISLDIYLHTANIFLFLLQHFLRYCANGKHPKVLNILI